MDKSCGMLIENFTLLCSLNKLYIFKKSEKEHSKLLKYIWVVCYCNKRNRSFKNLARMISFRRFIYPVSLVPV